MRVTATQVCDRRPTVRAGPLRHFSTFAATLLVALHAPAAQPRAHSNDRTALANADPAPVVRFVQSFTARGAALLRDGSLAADQRDNALRAMLLDGFDTKGAARFALGRGWRTATATQREEFVALFRKELLHKGKELFKDYEGEVLKVQRVQRMGPDTLMVETRLSNPAARINDVDFVVRKTRTELRIVDVRLEGFSMLDAYRTEFVPVLMQGGVERVLRQLRTHADF